MEFDDITRTESEQPAISMAPKQSVLPWVLLFITVAIFVGTTIFLWRRNAQETARANQTYIDKTRAEARATLAEQLLEGQKQSVDELSTELTAMSAKKKALEDQVAALEAKVASAKPTTKAAAKKTTKKKKRKR